MEAFLILLEKHKLVAEPAGAVTLAALMHGNIKLNGLTVPILSGGNIDVVTMSALIQRGLVKLGRVFEFAVDLPDRPGQLLNISRILAEQNANTIQIEHNQFQNIERFTHVRLKVKVETNGHDHIQDVVNALAEEGYPIVGGFGNA
jgi:threonine dehydratase